MKNIFGKTENLDLFDKDGKVVYRFCKVSGGYSYEYTYDSHGNVLTFKDSDGYSYELTYDLQGNPLTFKNSNGVSSEYTRDSNGKELTYKNSYGLTRGFDIPEYTMEELIEKIGNFKIKK
jgi:YD repeat-containing protein